MSVARPDRAFFFIAVACALAYVSLPRDTAYYDRWYQLFPVAAVGATLAGVWLNRPRSRAPWYLVAVSGLCAVTADALYAIQLEQVGDVPFPSTADYFALASYAVLAVALLLMIRRQAPGRDWPSLIDAGIVTVGVAIVGWTFLVQPSLTSDTSALETTVALAFPVMDVLLVSLAARMVLGPGLRSPAFAMVTIALLFQLVGDALYGFGSLHGWYQVGDSVDLFFVVAAVLWGTAALHPSMVELTEPNPDPEQRLSREAARRAVGRHAHGAGDARGRRGPGRIERAHRHRRRGSGTVRARDRPARRARRATRALRAPRACPRQRRGRARLRVDAGGHPSRHGRRGIRDRRRRRGSGRSDARRRDRRQSRSGKPGGRRS